MDKFKEMPQKFNTAQWLREKRQIDLSNKNEQEMAGFLILWTMFEHDILADENISSAIIREAPLVKGCHKKTLRKIHQWYIYRKPDRQIFEIFSFSGDLKKHIESYLQAEEKNDTDEKIFVIAVIYKFRCNLFHGKKHLESVARTQATRFQEFNHFLIECLETKQ